MSAAQPQSTRVDCVPAVLSPPLLRAKVASSQAQARLEALSREPAAVAWAEVMDALWLWVSSPAVSP